MKGQVKYDNKGTSFLQISKINLHDTNQWKIVDDIDLTEENKKLNAFIGMNKGNKFEVEKIISLGNTSPHHHVKLEMSFKFVNSLWSTNTAYIMVNDHLYWLDHHHWENKDCLSETWNTPIKIIHKYSENDLNIKFGIKINNNDILKCSEIIGSIKEIISFEHLTISVK